MSVLRKVMVAVLLAALASGAAAQPSSQPATAPSTGQAAAWEKNLPELRFDNVSFDDVAAFLSDVTGTNIVVIRDANVPPGLPRVNCQLKNVTLDQFANFLASAYGVEANNIDGPSGPITVLKLHMSDAVAASLPNQGGARIEVFNLGPIIDNLAEGGGKNAALSSVMSLIQTTLAQTNGPAPTLKVHEGTNSLVFKGTNEQRLLVQSTMAALQPSREAQQRAFDDQLRERDNAIKLESVRAKVEIDALKRQNELLEKELAQLRQQLNTNRPTTNP